MLEERPVDLNEAHKSVVIYLKGVLHSRYGSGSRNESVEDGRPKACN